MIFLDTGYFIALFTPDDDQYNRAMRWSLRIDEPLLVTEDIHVEQAGFDALLRRDPPA